MITMFNVVITMFNVVWLTPKLQPQAMPIKIHFQVYGLQPHLTKPHKPNSHTLTNLTNINNTSHKYKLIDKPHTQIQSQNLNNSLTLIKQTKSQHTYMDIIQPQKSTKLLFKETHSCSLKVLLLSPCGRTRGKSHQTIATMPIYKAPILILDRNGIPN